MFERTVRWVVETGQAHKWLRPLGILALLALFGGAALLRWAVRLAARAREAAGRVKAALGDLRRDCAVQRARRREQCRTERPARAPHRPARRVLAGTLSACMLAALLPVSALAEEGDAVTVAAFDALEEALAEQTVPAGTAREALNLPDTLGAAVYTTAPDTAPVVIEGVSWKPDARYEGEAGSYAFTASAAGYTPAQGVEWPVITVTVEEGAPEPDAIDALCAAIDALPEPEAVADMTGGEKDALSAQIDEALNALFTLSDADYDRFLAEHMDCMEHVAALQDALTGGVETLDAHTHAMSVDCSTEGTQVTFDKALTSQDGKLYIDGEAADKTNAYYDLPAGSYYLAGDVELDGYILMQGQPGPTVNLCLNGHKLAYTGSERASVIEIIAGTLSLCDCDGSGGNHTITSRATGESVAVSGGVVTGANKSAIDIAFLQGALNLYGGTIAGNGGTSGGVGSDTVYGGGVSNKGTFVMHGGSIRHNLGGYGGGVSSFGNLTIAGGDITYNLAKKAGGGVSVSAQSGSSITLSDAPCISSNMAGEEQTAANNLRLASRAVITVGSSFAPTTQIGVTTGAPPDKNRPVPITEANSADYSGYFKSDSDAYIIQSGADNAVQLRIKSADATLSALSYKVGNDGQTVNVPSFSANTESYYVELPASTAAEATITLTGTLNDGNAAITENDGVTLSGGSGTATVKVTAEDGTTMTYTVNFTTAADTRSDAKEITAFTIQNQVGGTVIKQDDHTIAVTMPAGTDVTCLTPSITVSDKATVSPASETAQDFTSPVTYTVTAENGTTQTYTVTVTMQTPSGTAPTITTQTLPGGTVGTAYSQTLAADGTAPITWSVSNGSLPDGLNLNTGTGVISGTPTVAGTFTFTVKAENSAGSDTKELYIQIGAPSATVTGVTVTPATASVQKGSTQQFSAAVTGTNDPAQTVTWTVEGGMSGTTMTTGGLLTVDANEMAAALTVKATSTVDTGKSGTAIVTVTNTPVTKYTLTVNGGSGSGEYEVGAEITVTANAPAQGKQFKEWTAAGITLADAAQNPITITMPANAVMLAAAYKDAAPPAATYTVTFNAGGGSVTPASAQTGADGKLQSLPTPTRSNHRFDGWFTAAEGGTAVTTDTVFTQNSDIYAHWTNTGGSSSSGGGSSPGGSHTTTEKHPDGSTTTTVTKPNGTVTETTKAPDGTKTVVETKRDGTKTETVEAPDGVKTETVTTPQGDQTYTEQRPDGTKISAHAPRSGQATATVTLPERAGETVVSFPVTDGTVVLRVLPDGAEEPVPFSLVAGGRVYVRLDGDAELKVETRTGLFDDMGGHWAEQSADFTGARALFEGVAPRAFAPEQTMTRAMLTTVLYRMDGQPEAGQAAFADVDAAAWYAPSAAWSYEHGIAAGDGGAFDGGRAVTRQELAVMLWRYAKYEGLDGSAGGDSLSASDRNEAAEWAVPALEWARGLGILQGDADGDLDPTGTASRAEAASALERFVIAVLQ